MGSIGYIDSGHGHKYGLSEIALKNHDGYYVTSKEANIGAAATSAVETGAFPSSHLADFSSVNLYDQPGKNTYPITMLTYVYLFQDMSHMNGRSAGVLLALLEIHAEH